MLTKHNIWYNRSLKGGVIVVQGGLRLNDIWHLIPENHVVVLRVKLPDKHLYYTARHYASREEQPPYERKFAKVLSVYAITTELIEITIEENKFTKG